MNPSLVHRVLSTPRLRLRWFEPGDAADQQFLIELVNDPDWIAFIGRRDVSTREQAEAYLRQGPRAMCERLGYGLLLVERLESGQSVGMCGLVRREGLDSADLGFAFLPAGRGQGLAREAAQGVLRWAREDLRMDRVLAIVTPENDRSIGLLQRLGFVREGTVTLPGSSETLLSLAWSGGCVGDAAPG
jgi:RimJ/RimL family protein N-acetyltransferase